MADPSGERIPSVSDDALSHGASSTSADKRLTVPVTSPPGLNNAVTLSDSQEHGRDTREPIGVFGRYQLLEEVAAGGMGVVYKARDTTLGRIVALKMIRSGRLARADEVQRFHREARAAANLRHPNIIELYEVGEHDGRHYFTMALAEGGSLDRHLDRFADARSAAALMMKIARAVHHAHERGILHRDLKPANVLLDSGDEPRVCDFGLAKLADSDVELTQTGQFIGTPAYMAPEQAVSRSEGITASADVWALGVLLYQLLTGRRPFACKERDELLRQIRTCDPPDPSSIRPGVNRTLEAIVLKCLAKDPSQRYASAELLANDLECWLQGEPTRERPASLPRRWWRKAARHPWRNGAIAAACVVLVAIAASLGAHLIGDSPPIEPAPIVLIDGEGAHQPLQWTIGETYLKSVSNSGVPLSIETSEISAARLMDHVPWEKYRVEAEMRHDAADGRSEIGLFLAEGAPNSDPMVPPSVFVVGFGDMGAETGEVQIGLFRVDRPDATIFESHAFPASVIFPAAERLGKPSSFRKLDLEVTAAEVRVFLDGEALPVMSKTEIESGGTHLFRGFPNVHWQFKPQAGLGIYAVKGRLTIQKLTVKPL
jgi:serine/threonine protein kinase